MLEIYIKL